MAWTEQMVEDLKKMWHEGLTTGEIGKRLGVPRLHRRQSSPPAALRTAVPD